MGGFWTMGVSTTNCRYQPPSTFWGYPYPLLFSITFPFFAAKLLCFLRDSRIFVQAIAPSLCFHRHSWVVRSIMNP
jgi:hypothetical protein